nr:tetratricopeptide repeat protein [uncultured Carboxylicivirga sp.]
MKKYNIIILTILLIFSSCKISKNVTSEEVNSDSIDKVVLDESDQRKFDYFFYEAGREKMKGNLQKAAMYLTECLKIDPTSSASMYELANILVAGNEVNKAQVLLERAVVIEPENIWYSLLLAELYQQNKEGQKAISIYEKLVANDSDNDEYLYGLAQMYANNSQFDKAIKAYDQLEKRIGLNEILILEKEQVYLQKGDNKSALVEVQKLIKKYPDEPRFYGYLADYYLYVNDIENAKASFNVVLEKDPENALAYFSLGNIAKSENDTLAFKDYYLKGLSQKSTSFDVKFQRIMPLLMEGNGTIIEHDYLEDFFKVLIETHPFESNAYIYLGNYYKAINKDNKALESYEHALSIQAKNELIWQEYILLLLNNEDYKLVFDKAKTAVSYFPQNSFFYLIGASAAMQIQNNEIALELLEKGYLYVGDNKALKAQYLATMGDVYYSLNQADKAFAVYEESLKIDEFNIVVLNNYSYYLTLENKNLEKAEKMSSKCIDLEPSNATYLDTYAWVLFKRERYFEAKYIIERALDNGGNESDVIVEHYGDILFKNGDVDNALKQWNLSESMGNTSELLKKKIETKSYIEE